MDGDTSEFWKNIGRAALIVTIIAGIFTVIQVLHPFSSAANNTRQNTANTNQDFTNANSASGPAAASISPTATTLMTAPLPTDTPTPRAVSPGTVLCSGGGSHGWDGWSLGSSWHNVSGTLVNDGSDSAGSYTPDLLPPDSCQGVTANVAIKARIKVDALGLMGFGLDARGQDTSNGWGGYTLKVDVTCYDSGNSSCAQPYLYVVHYDPNENQLGQAQVGVGVGVHLYELDVQGNAVTAKVDGATIMHASDNEFLSAGQVGLYCKDQTQIEVSSVDVIAL